ncbi:MAG: Na/Pi cotransporter family protein, partial [Lachnospiraceae bacterium]|nr:Na/Pi cotransporter family protein [Lachnospiraceae bacterium]
SISLLGGLALFLYGMRLMGSGLKDNSSGVLKRILERVTNNLLKAFLLGIVVTALIQSSNATTILTAGLVAAGVISLKSAVGIVIGANIGTTITGQIIRLLDVNSNGASSWIEFIKPSTLAPVALIIGIVFIMFIKAKKSESVGTILMGFGVLFTGLLSMTDAAGALTRLGLFDGAFVLIGDNPLIGAAVGAVLSFILQSASATVGVVQAFSTTGALAFRGIYAVLLGIYVGSSAITCIICSIGVKANGKRVGMVNLLFNVGKAVIVLIVILILHALGVLDFIWDKTATSGLIANTNSIFNIGAALVLLPMAPLFEKTSRMLVKNDKEPVSRYQEKFEALNPNFYRTPAIAFRSAYDALLTMFDAAKRNIDAAYALLFKYDENVHRHIEAEEAEIDQFADRLSNYLVEFSPYIKQEDHVAIMTEYYKITSEFERLGDHAMNLAEEAKALRDEDLFFSEEAVYEFGVLKDLLDRVMGNAREAVYHRSSEAARSVEPLEEVVDDMIETIRAHHLTRLTLGECRVEIDSIFQNIMTDMERISDICSNIGLAVLVRIYPEQVTLSHDYTAALHRGEDETFNRMYEEAYGEFYTRLNAWKKKKSVEAAEEKAAEAEKADT